MLDEIAAYLEAQSLGTVKAGTNNPAWPIFTGGVFPGTQNDAISVAESAGEGVVNEMGSTVGSVAAEAPALVVQVRSMSYASARTKAEAIWRKLHKYAGTLSGVRYYLVLARSKPFPLGRDDGGAFLLGFNCDVTKEPS
jgi:hypothetical protein